MLEKHPLIDYFLMPPAPLPEVGVTFGAVDQTKLFRSVRELAFSKGDRTSVGLMYRLLNLKIKTTSAAGFHGLDGQIMQEFGFTVEELREELRVINDALHEAGQSGL
jgi:hypothetical protein